MNERLTWLISGCSRGLGRAMAERVCAHGMNVVATTRDAAALESLAVCGDTVLARRMDVTNSGEIERVVGEAVERFGRIDVLVNNATGRLHGSIEDVPDEDCRALFETNVFGALALTRAVLPQMRRNQAGTIVNVSSLGGLAAQAGLGHYSATKFAIEGLSEALALECAPFGVRVLVAVPTSVRTDWAGITAETSRPGAAEYETTSGRTRRLLAERAGRQPGDPERAAEALMLAVLSDTRPFRLFLGDQGLQRIRDKLAGVEADLDCWREISFRAPGA